jgi:hypothetical protein
MYWYARLWSPLQKIKNRDLFTEVSTRLEDRTRDTFPYMGGHIIYGLVDLLLLRRSTIALYDIYLTFLVFFRLLDGCVNLSYAKVGCIA